MICSPIRRTTRIPGPACRRRRSRFQGRRRCSAALQSGHRAGRCTSSPRATAGMPFPITLDAHNRAVVPLPETLESRPCKACSSRWKGSTAPARAVIWTWLEAWFKARGFKVRMTREPGGRRWAKNCARLVLHEPMHAETEALIMFAARREHLEQVIRPALAAKGEVVISDRFTDASFAYQCGGRGLPDARLEVAGINGSTATCNPDLTLLFDLAPEIAARRLANTRTPDRFEREQGDFHAPRAGCLPAPCGTVGTADPCDRRQPESGGRARSSCRWCWSHVV
jgi:dTMP kinase